MGRITNQPDLRIDWAYLDVNDNTILCPQLIKLTSYTTVGICDSFKTCNGNTFYTSYFILLKRAFLVNICSGYYTMTEIVDHSRSTAELLKVQATAELLNAELSTNADQD